MAAETVQWDPQVYLEFATERARPFHDLVARIPGPARRTVVDLGCGPGGLTASLAQTWPQARVLGVDSSPDMLGKAAQYAVPGRVEFTQADVRDWTAVEPVDVIVTNATLQWVPDHLDLLPRLVAQLAPGGRIALQLPGNHDAPLHALLFALSATPRWADRLPPHVLDREPVPDPVDYVEVLAAAGCSVDAWETTYLHVLDPPGRLGGDAVLAWAQGTALRPVLSALDEAERGEFLEAYAAALRPAYPRRPWGTPLPFRRVFAVAARPEAGA